MNSYIQLENVSVNIPVYGVDMSFRSALLNSVGGTLKKQKDLVIIEALKDINFKLEAGDRLGLIGHNGAGKTTLLSVMAGIYKPECGKIHHHGKITTLFNLGLGMDPVDTGIENIKTIGLYLGMTKQQILNAIDDIVDFTELGDYIHLPVRTYSAGMIARLTFAIATSLEPNILLMDEGIGAGDSAFANKAKQRLDDFFGKIGIMVVASHSNDLIRKMCNKALLLEKGRIISFGSVENVFEEYSATQSI